MLVLFDIDQTLISTHAAGRNALQLAGQSLFDDTFTFDGVSFSGRLDPLIIAELLTKNGIEPSPEHHASMRKAYAGMLPGVLEACEPCALRGAMDLVNLCDICSEVTLGVLTGNYAETGGAKLEACGFSLDQFEVKVWGDASPNDPPHRNDLPPIGLARCNELRPDPVGPESTVIIGDTVHDIECARVNGMRSLGVATGRYTAEELLEAGADRVAADLTGTDELLAWIVQEPYEPKPEESSP